MGLKMIGKPKTMSSLMLKIIGPIAVKPKPLLALFFEKIRMAINKQIVAPQPPIKTKMSKNSFVKSVPAAAPSPKEIKYVLLTPSNASLPWTPKNHKTDDNKTKKKPLKKPFSPKENKALKALIYKSRKEATLKTLTMNKLVSANAKVTSIMGNKVDIMRLNS